MYQYRPSQEQVNELKDRMRNGTGASRLLHAQNAPTHYIDSLQRFKKDFSSYDKQQRQLEKQKRQQELQKKRLDQLQRQNKRWSMVQQYQDKLKTRQQVNLFNLNMGLRKSANTPSLAYNPINLAYDKNTQGQKLKHNDEQARIRRFVRAKNMQDRGNSRYNPINGQARDAIKKVIPSELNDRYNIKLANHYENLILKAPSSNVNNTYQTNFQPSRRYY